VSTNAPDSPAAPIAVTADGPQPQPASAYDAPVLREQMAILRRESATRAKAEREITAEHETATEAATSSATAALASTRKKYAAEIETARREHAAVLQKADAFATTELKKLDDARQARAKSLQVACAKKVADLKEEADFAGMAANETAKAGLKQPVIAFAKGESEIGRTVAQLDEAVAAAAKQLAKRGVKSAAPVADEPASIPPEELPADPLKELATLRDAVVEKAKAIAGLPAVKQAFSSGLQGAVVAGPLVLAAVAAAGGFFALGSLGLMMQAAIAGGAAAMILAGGLGGGFWFLGRKRAAARAELAALHGELAEMASAGKRLVKPARERLTARRDEQSQKLKEKFRKETDDRKTKLEADCAEQVAKRDADLAALEAKYREGCEKLAAKVAEHRAFIEQAGTLADRRARNLRSEVLGIATARLRRRLEATIHDDPAVADLLERVVNRELDPSTAAAQLLEGEIDV
jgi:hypothetical protein